MTSVAQLEGIYFALVMHVAARGRVAACRVRAWCHLTLVDCPSPKAEDMVSCWLADGRTVVAAELQEWFESMDCALPICPRLKEITYDGSWTAQPVFSIRGLFESNIF